MRHVVLLIGLSLFLAAQPLRAQSTVSEASMASVFPVAVSVVAVGVSLSQGAAFSVAAVEMSADGAVWVLERASDGARVVLTFVGEVAGGSLLALGTVVVVTAVAAGWILSVAGEVVAFVPGELGKALLYNERLGD